MQDSQLNDFSATSRQVPPPIKNHINNNSTKSSPTLEPITKKRSGCLVPGIIGGIGILTIFMLFFLLAIVAALFGSPKKSSFTEKYISGDEFSENKIAVIDISGIILTSGPARKVASARTICEQLDYLVREDSNVKAVVLRINSPGGGVVASDIIHQAILRLREEHKIPVIAVMETVAASGGYYIAVACDHIIANRLTITGSIGVIAQSYNYHQLLGKIGVSAKSYKSGNMKDMLNPANPRDPAADAIMQQMINSTYDEFVKIVAAGRKDLTVKQIKASVIGDSRILDGAQAYKLKLIDQLGYFEDAIAVAAKRAKLGDDYVVVNYQPPFSIANIFSFKAPVDKLKIELPGNGKIAAELKPGQLYFLPIGL